MGGGANDYMVVSCFCFHPILTRWGFLLSGVPDHFQLSVRITVITIGFDPINGGSIPSHSTIYAK